MPFDSFNSLVTAIPAWAMRSGDTEFAAQVPDFITLAEMRINRSLRVSAMEKSAVLTANAFGLATLPADYLEYRNLNPGVAGYEEMELVPPGEEIGAYPCGSVPRRFSVSGNALSIYPAGASSVILTYYAKVPALSSSNQTNWLLAAAPDLYLYGALLEAAPYMEEDQRAAVWKTYYDTAMADLKASDVGARYATGKARVRQQTP